MSPFRSWDDRCLGALRRLLERYTGECHHPGERERLSANLADVMAEVGKRLTDADDTARILLRSVDDGD